jgi:LAS superfamily LD-carboxypeptidase LdcB
LGKITTKPAIDPGFNPGKRLELRFVGLLAVLSLFMAGCRPAETDQITVSEVLFGMEQVPESPLKNQPAPNKKTSSVTDGSRTPTPIRQSSPTTPVLSTTLTAQALAAALEKTSPPQPITPTIQRETATAVPLIQCDQRFPGDDLLAVVTLDYGLSRDFAPDDLIALADHLPFSVTLGYPTEVREVMLQPLVEMLNDMISQGLMPQILSGYRSYPAQAIAWDKWQTLYPDHASIISAPPGHSEHQLGTVIDFGSPELPEIVGQSDIQFHTYFYKTSEGQWLSENAHKYGFTLSYPTEAFEITGFYYEPWHYRFVGESMARQLHEKELSLTEFQLAEKPQPCQP